MNILVVEDEPKLRETLSRMLRSIGHLPSTADSARAAEQQIKDDPPDALLLDLNMPRMGGLDLLQRVRRTHTDMPVVILTGFGDLPSAQRAIHLGVREFLTKPCLLGDIERAFAPTELPPRPPLPMSLGDDDQEQGDTHKSSSRTPAADVPLFEVERAHILAALQRHDGNRRAAAQELGISLRTLYYRLRLYRQADA